MLMPSARTTLAKQVAERMHPGLAVGEVLQRSLRVPDRLRGITPAAPRTPARRGRRAPPARLRELKQEARKVGRNLSSVVRSIVRDGEDRSPLIDLLISRISGRLTGQGRPDRCC